MSELKWKWVYFPQHESAVNAGYVKVVSKDEADKVIADLEESHKMEVEQLLIEIAELKAQKAQAEDDCAYWKTMLRKNVDDNEVMAKQRAKSFERKRHSDYKLCLAMAKICENKLGTIVKPGWWDKWRRRWLELAAQFKEAK